MGCGGYNWHGEIHSASDISDYVRELNLKRPLPEWVHDMLYTLQTEDVPVTFIDSKYRKSRKNFHKIKIKIKCSPFRVYQISRAQRSSIQFCRNWWCSIANGSNPWVRKQHFDCTCENELIVVQSGMFESLCNLNSAQCSITSSFSWFSRLPPPHVCQKLFPRRPNSNRTHLVCSSLFNHLSLIYHCLSFWIL